MRAVAAVHAPEEPGMSRQRRRPRGGLALFFAFCTQRFSVRFAPSSTLAPLPPTPPHTHPTRNTLHPKKALRLKRPVLCCVHVPRTEPLLLAVAERALLAALADMGLVRFLCVYAAAGCCSLLLAVGRPAASVAVA